MFSHHSGFKLKISNRKTSGKSPNIYKLHKTYFNNPWIKEEIKEKLKHIEFVENESTVCQNYVGEWDTAQVIWEGKFVELKCFHQKAKKKSSYPQGNLPHEETNKREADQIKRKQKERILKNRNHGN